MKKFVPGIALMALLVGLTAICCIQWRISYHLPISSDVVAQVDRQGITQSDVDTEWQVLRFSIGTYDQEMAETITKEDVLNILIDRLVTKREIQRKQISLSDAEIESINQSTTMPIQILVDQLGLHELNIQKNQEEETLVLEGGAALAGLSTTEYLDRLHQNMILSAERRILVNRYYGGNEKKFNDYLDSQREKYIQ